MMRRPYIPTVRPVALFLAIFLCLNPCLAAGAEAPATESTGKYVSIDFNNVDIGVFIKFISELTGKNFIVDDRVRGKVTVISPSKISVDEAYRVFQSVLEIHGFTPVEAGSMVKIVPSPDARSKSIETLLQEESGDVSDRVVTQILTLDYADPEILRKLLAPLVSKNSVLLAYPPSGMLILTDVYSNIERLNRIIQAIDVAGTGNQIAVIPLQNAEATKMEKIVATVFNPPKARARKAAPDDQLQVVADERTNSLIVMASEDDITRIRSLIDMLDTETPRGQGKIRVYYLENAIAEDLAKVLQDVPTTEEKAAKTPKAQPVAVSPGVKITADKATNSLIIMAEKQDYEVLEEIIAKLDIPRSMVYIECLIMEVNVDKEFSIGTEWSGFGKTNLDQRPGGFGGGFRGGDSSSIANLAQGGGLVEGGAFGIFGETLKIAGQDFLSLGAVIEAYKKDNDVHIISTPQILTTDNQEAKIYIGKNVPFQTRQSTSTNDIDYSSYEYKDVGTTLKITPRISQERMVRLDISQEVTTLESESAIGSNFRPTTLKRTIDTTVLVQDGHTVVIGGLIDDKANLTENKIPGLGDIPLFGWLFKTRGRGNVQTNLFVFLTPRVVKNSGEASGLYSEKKAAMDRVEAESPLRQESEDGGKMERPSKIEARDIKLYPGPSKDGKTAAAGKGENRETP